MKRATFAIVLDVVLMCLGLALAVVTMADCAAITDARDGYLAEPPPPPGALAAFDTAQATFEATIGEPAPVESVTWIRADQCGYGVPSIEIGPNQCAKSRALGCALFVAVGDWSDGRIASALAFCHAHATLGDATAGDYSAVIESVNAAIGDGR